MEELEAKHKLVQEDLRKKTNSLGVNVQQRAVGLRERANSMRQQTQSKLRELDDLEVAIPQNEMKIKGLSDEIDRLLQRMNDAYSVIDQREKYYRSCSL